MSSSLHIALLRGVNVGGHRNVPMPALRGVFESLGLERVQMSGLWLIVGAGLMLRTWAFRLAGARRLALLVTALVVPLHVILIGQGVPADALHWLLALGRSVPSVGALLLIVLVARLPVWFQVVRQR